MKIISLFLFLLPANYAFVNKYKLSCSFFPFKKNFYLSSVNNQDQDYDDDEITRDDDKSMNRLVRLGRSKDQDGKSNIWSVEPTMEVVEVKEGDPSEVNKNIVTFGLIVTGIIASLPILYTLNYYIMDMDY
jgi:hypothetical protein